MEALMGVDWRRREMSIWKHVRLLFVRGRWIEYHDGEVGCAYFVKNMDGVRYVLRERYFDV